MLAESVKRSVNVTDVGVGQGAPPAMPLRATCRCRGCGHPRRRHRHGSRRSALIRLRRSSARRRCSLLTWGCVTSARARLGVRSAALNWLLVSQQRGLAIVAILSALGEQRPGSLCAQASIADVVQRCGFSFGATLRCALSVQDRLVTHAMLVHVGADDRSSYGTAATSSLRWLPHSSRSSHHR